MRLGAPAVVVTLACAVVATVGIVGGDSRWLAALGRTIVDRGSIPHGVPYASAPSGDWPNVPVLAELLLHWLVAGLGDHGLLLAQVVAVGAALALLAVDMRRNGSDETAAAVVLAVIVVGASATLVVIRLQLFSLVLFPALVLLLRSQARSPSRWIWLVPVLLALWSNLHGAVLVGLVVAAIYLALSRLRRRPLESAGVLLASVVAVSATPALERTPAYYVGVLRNEAARQGEGLWAPLSIHSGFDVVLIATAVILVGLALRRRPALWELAALGALAYLTIRTARSGVWLLFFAGPLAAPSLHLSARMRRPWPALLAVAISLAAAYEVATGPHSPDVSGRLVRETMRQAHGTAVLADDRFAEQLALAGGRIWMGNPLDAFPRRDQAVYLDWLEGRANGRAAFAHAPRAVLVHRGGAADGLTATMRQFRVLDEDANAVLYVRR